MGTSLIISGGISGVDCDSATATAPYVLVNKTFGGASSDELITGAMPNIGAQTGTISAPTGSTQSITIKRGKHNGSGYIKQSITVKGSPSVTLAINGSYTIPAGWYTGGSITQSITTQGATTLTGGTAKKTVASGRYMTGNVTIAGSANLVSGYIKKGVSLWNVSGSLVDYSAQQEAW